MHIFYTIQYTFFVYVIKVHTFLHCIGFLTISKSAYLLGFVLFLRVHHTVAWGLALNGLSTSYLIFMFIRGILLQRECFKHIKSISGALYCTVYCICTAVYNGTTYTLTPTNTVGEWTLSVLCYRDKRHLVVKGPVSLDRLSPTKMLVHWSF